MNLTVYPVEGDVRVDMNNYYDMEYDSAESDQHHLELVTIEDIMLFCTGISKIPVGGFHVTPSIIFLHGHEQVLATASTCSLQLRLPTKYHNDYEAFGEKLVLSLKGNM